MRDFVDVAWRPLEKGVTDTDGSSKLSQIHYRSSNAKSKTLLEALGVTEPTKSHDTFDISDGISRGERGSQEATGLPPGIPPFLRDSDQQALGNETGISTSQRQGYDHGAPLLCILTLPSFVLGGPVSRTALPYREPTRTRHGPLSKPRAL